MNLSENVINVVSWVTKINPKRICMSTALKDDLQLDDIDTMSITLEIEKWFNIELTKEDAAQIETVKDLQDLVYKYKYSRQHQAA